MNKFFKRLALLLAVLMIVSMMPVQLFADNSVIVEGQSNGTGENSYLTISGIAGFEGRKFASFADAYAAIKPELEGLCADHALDEGVATAGAFDALFTNRDENGNATLTYTISGNIVYDETGYANLLTMGRRASHYGNDRHLINFKFVGATGKEADTLTVNSNITLPYEWWGEKTVTSISFENLTITGSAPSGLYPSQSFFEGINFKVDNCNLKGIKIYNCSNVKGTYTITNSTLDGTGAPADAYAIHLQGNETEPLTINISGNTISGYDRGINIDQNTANATISSNKISIKDAGRSCIQLSSLANVAIADNTLELTGGNAITLHEKLLTLTAAPKITVEGNAITGNGYLIYDDAAANNNAFTSENLKLTIDTNTVASTVYTTQGVKGSNKYGISETVATVVKEALTTVATVNGVGYATLADAIAAANGNGTVTLLTATTELVQALLDGQYGSIDGLTIELPAGGYGKLELGRATKYAGSNTEYFVGGFDSTDKNYKAFTNADEIRVYKGQSTWTPNCFYRRALKNVTIKAADGATVTIEKISADAGQIYGKADAPKYDYVLDVEIPDTNKSYYMALAWNNVTFEGINFKSSVNIESSSEKTLIDGLHFEKCNFNSGYTELAAANDANKASKGMGIRFVSWTKTTNNLRNLTVNNCTFEDCYEGVYTNPVYGVSVTNSSFNNINHNAVAIQDVDSAVNHGNVVISGNTFTNVSDRIIRFNNVGDGTTITITGNTSVNSGKKDNGEIIKATTMPDSVNVNMTSNTWGNVNGKTAVLGNGFKPTSATIDASKYETLDDAIKAAKDDDVIVVSAGEYKLNGSLTYTGKAFTIKAADGVKVSFDMSAAVALHGAKITFEGVTFDYKTNGNYIGIQHADTLVYNNCTINGMVFLYATNETFNDCIFKQTSADAYNVWTYGAKNVEFNRCVFNCVGKSVLLYNENKDHSTNLTVADTTFTASAPVAGKAAIEIDTSLMSGANVTVDNATADKTTGFAAGSHSGNTLWNDKANEKASDNENVTVVVADETVYEPAIIDLDTFIKKLVASGYKFDGKLKNGGKLTVKWSPVSGCFDEHHALGADCPKTAATGNTPKRLNSGLLQFQLFKDLNTAVIIKNVKFVYEPADVKICVNSGWKGSFTAEQAPAGQLYFMTTGDVTVESCDFEKVVFTTFNTTGTSIVNGCTFKYVYNSYAIKDIRGENVSVTGTTIENCGGGIMVSSTGAVSNVTITRNTFNNVDTAGTAPEGKVGTRAILQIASSGDYASTAFDFSGNTATSCGPVIRQLNATVAPVGSSLKYLTESPNSASGLYTSDSKGSKKNPYTLEELGAMTRAEYIAAQEALGGTMYVEIGNYSYDKDGVLGNGVRNDTPGQTEDRSVLNGYNSNGYLGKNNDGANGKNIIFVGGSITSGVTGYASIDNIGTSLLLAVPAYTNVTFEGTTFNNVMSFDYQLYTGPWSQLGKLKFDNCKFNGLIVGAIAAQTLTFNGCEFENYTNTTKENNSNPTWIRPAYGNWTQGDNEGQGSDFRSLTTINFTGNKVTSTRPVKFEYISQWEMDTKVTVTGNKFDIKSDGSSKNVGLYFGANAKFDLVVDNNEKTDGTAALYTAVYKAPNGTDYAGLPAGSTVKDSNGADVEVAGVIWKTTDALTLKTTTEAVKVGGVKFATLEEAFAAAKNGDTITLLSDVEMTEIIRVTDSKKITLALNGFNVTITATGKFIRVCNAELTITGNGTIKEQNPYFAPIIIKGGAEGSENYSVVNIKEGVTLEGWAGVMIDQTSGTANNYGMVLNVEGATLNGVNDTDGASGSGIYVNGVVEDAKITLTNTTVTGTGAGMYLAGNADTTINGGSVKGDATGIEIRAGKLTLNNCDVTGGNGEVTATANGNGTTVTNAALAISQHTTKKPIDVTINGGTFNGTAAVYQTDVQGTGSADVKIAVKSGTFNGTISGETDGTIAISGGKFKVKVDDKYFANGHVCSGNPGADGYYTIADHPITNMGLSIGEGLSLRIYLLDGVTTGKLRVTYTKPDGEEVSYIIDETEFELVGNEESGYTEKYFFRIFNITPQMADMTITVQYIGEDGKDFGSAKEVSILKYCEGYIAKYPTENVKTFVSKLLEYCASAMDYVAIKYSEQVYNGKTWTERATALRAEKERLCGTDVPTFDFKELGTNSKFGRKIFDTNGIIFGESLTFYLGIRKENYNPDYHYIPTGSNETKPVFDEKSGEYRFYFTMAPYEYNTSMRIVVKSGNSTICERATSLDFLLNKYSAGDSAAARFCKAAYEYCRALEAVIKDINK